MQEQELEELRLKTELELSRAKLNVCQEIGKEQAPSLEEDLAYIPSESKGKGVERFLQSLCTYQRPSQGGDHGDICGHGAGFDLISINSSRRFRHVFVYFDFDSNFMLKFTLN